MATQIEVCNRALMLLGQPSILSIEDRVPNAEACSIMWPFAFETVLRAYPWPFAIKRAILPRLAEKPVYQFTHMYALPADALRLVRIDLGTDWSYDYKEHYEEYVGTEYTIEGTNILTNHNTVRVRYVSREIAIGQLDAETVKVLSYQLAIDLSVKITADQQLKNQLYAELEQSMSAARNVWSTESHPIYPTEGMWIPGRYGGTWHA